MNYQSLNILLCDFMNIVRYGYMDVTFNSTVIMGARYMWTWHLPRQFSCWEYKPMRKRDSGSVSNF